MSSTDGKPAATRREPVLVDLALQGGGSHGAFTWGVLDRLLEEPWIKIEAISGTSAGAMNAAVLVDGWSRDEAHKQLEKISKDVLTNTVIEEYRFEIVD